MLALAGVVGGMMLGEMAVGSRSGSGSGETASYSHLSANPDALVPQGAGAAPCPGCADSYGVAVRMRAQHNDRMSDEFRELGAVDADPQQTVEPVDDYSFGGRFPDPEPRARSAMAEVRDLPATPPAGDAPPPDEALRPPMEY